MSIYSFLNVKYDEKIWPRCRVLIRFIDCLVVTYFFGPPCIRTRVMVNYRMGPRVPALPLRSSCPRFVINQIYSRRRLFVFATDGRLLLNGYSNRGRSRNAHCAVIGARGRQSSSWWAAADAAKKWWWRTASRSCGRLCICHARTIIALRTSNCHSSTLQLSSPKYIHVSVCISE